MNEFKPFEGKDERGGLGRPACRAPVVSSRHALRGGPETGSGRALRGWWFPSPTLPHQNALEGFPSASLAMVGKQ